jgi:LysR family transcriptional regulator, transcriptional activator for bauABCD operon
MRLSNPDLKALNIFKTIVDNQGFRGAQLELGASASVISTSMKSLEERVGFRLCHRGKGGFKLTEKGRQVYELCNSLVHTLDRFEMALGELRKTLRGTLRIGLSANTVTDENLRIYEVIHSFEELRYKVFFDISVLPTELLERGLLTGEFQFAIAPFVNHIKNLHYEKLYLEQNRLYCAKGNPLFARSADGITLADITRERFASRTYLHQGDLAHLEGARVAASASSMEAQLMLILSGFYVGYLAEHYAAPWVEKGVLRALNHPGLAFSLQFYLAWPRSGELPVLTKTFTQELLAKAVVVKST